MRTGKLSEVIADLQMIHARFGELPVTVAVRNSKSVGLIPFGGISVITLNGGELDGQDAAVLFDQDLKPTIVNQTQRQEGEVLE